MSRRDRCRVQLVCAVGLSLCLSVLVPRSAAAWQGPATPPADDQRVAPFVLPRWEIDFRKVDSGAPDVNRPPSFYFYKNEDQDQNKGPRPKAETREPDSNGVLVLEIPIGNALHPQFLEIFGPDGFKCALEGAPNALARTPGSVPRQPIDEILFQTETPENPNVGWIEVKLTNQRNGDSREIKITKDDPGMIRLSIHHWGELYRKVGAGIFSGSLILEVSNPHLQGGQPFRLLQPLNLVISGSRLISVEVPKTLRVGTKPKVRVEIESVETVEPNASDELDPGWWLQFNEPKNPNPVARVPVPLPLVEATNRCVYRVSGKEKKGETRGWDTIELPPKLGFELADEWRDQLILQRLERGPNLAEPTQVRMHRHTIVTYLPASYKPSNLDGLVIWDPTNTRKTDSTDPANAGKESATRKTMGPIAISSGLRVSTDLPVTHENFDVWAVIDTKMDLTQEGALEKVPNEVTVDLLEQVPATKEWSLKESITLKWPEGSQINPNEPTIARYQSSYQFDTPGYYKLKLTGWPDLTDVEIPARVLIEGESKAQGFGFEDDYPIKVFTDRQPFWWIPEEPGFTVPHSNLRPIQGYRTITSQSISFLLAPGHELDALKLHYAGIYFDPAENGSTIAARQKPYVNSPQKPSINLFEWNKESGPPSPGTETKAADVADRDLVTEAAAGTRWYYDLDVELGKEREAGNQLRLARFVFVGVDNQGKPIGRVYSRHFKVAVRSFGDEFWIWIQDQGAVLALIGLVLVILGVILYKRYLRIKKEKAKAAKRAEAQESPRIASANNQDLFSGLDATTDEHDDHVPPPRPKAPPTAPEPSYFDKPENDDDDTGGLNDFV